MMITVDARGISCPEPLMMLKNALQNNKEVLVMVDSKNALENCKEYALANGAAVAVKSQGDEYRLTIKTKG